MRVYFTLCFLQALQGGLIKVFMRVYFDGFFAFFLGLLFLGIIGGTPDKRIYEGLFCFFCCRFGFLQALQGGPLINVFLRVYFALCFFCCCFGFLQPLQGGPLINVFLRVYFDVLFFLCVCLVFIGIILGINKTAKLKIKLDFII